MHPKRGQRLPALRPWLRADPLTSVSNRTFFASGAMAIAPPSIEGRLPRPCPGATTSRPSRNLYSLVLGGRWVVTWLDGRLPRRLAPSTRWGTRRLVRSPVIYANVRNSL